MGPLGRVRNSGKESDAGDSSSMEEDGRIGTD